MLLLPLSIVPVLLLGSVGAARAGGARARGAAGKSQRAGALRCSPAASHRHPGLAASELSKLPRVSLGPVYGALDDLSADG